MTDDELVAYMPRVRGVAFRILQTKHLPPSVLHEDLVGDGLLGLVEARNRYQPERGDFWAFAAKYIYGAIWHGLWRGSGTRPKWPTLERVYDDVDHVSPEPSPDDLAQRCEVVRLAHALPARQRRAVMGWAWGESTREIAARWRLHQTQVQRAQQSGLKALKAATGTAIEQEWAWP